MKTIWKYALLGIERQKLRMPKEAQILSVQMQGKELCVWALVNPTNDGETRFFEIFGSGMPVPDAARLYLNTVQDGGFVWHIFERLK
jgi:hypothetical protein